MLSCLPRPDGRLKLECAHGGLHEITRFHIIVSTQCGHCTKKLFVVFKWFPRYCHNFSSSTDSIIKSIYLNKLSYVRKKWSSGKMDQNSSRDLPKWLLYLQLYSHYSSMPLLMLCACFQLEKEKGDHFDKNGFSPWYPWVL